MLVSNVAKSTCVNYNIRKHNESIFAANSCCNVLILLQCLDVKCLFSFEFMLTSFIGAVFLLANHTYITF